MRTMERITQRLVSPLTLTLAMVTLGTLCPAPASAADTLDQSQPASQSPANISNTPKAQIFTAGAYGALDRVSLYLDNFTTGIPAGAVLKVSVQTVIAGLPSGKEIGSGTIPLTAIPPPNSAWWVDVDIAGAIVHAGTPYALVLQTSPWNAVVNWWNAYQNAYGSSYAGGSMVVNDGTSWRIDVNYDFAFKTYVNPDVLDQSQTTLGDGWTWWALGQTFTPTVSGYLDRVIVFIRWEDPTPLRFTLQTVTNAGLPSGNVIGQGWHDAPCCYPDDASWITVNINDAPVIAGHRYALVIESESRFGGLQVPGLYTWYYAAPDDVYPGGHMMLYDGAWHLGNSDAAFKTYIIPVLMTSSPPPPPARITPCSSGICPAVSGKVTPPDSTARVTSNVQFWELPNGTVHGILDFDDSKTGNLVLHGCTTDSAACGLTVRTFVCTDPHAITVAGFYKQKGETLGDYLLTLSGVKGGIGTFTLTTQNDTYTYTLTRYGTVDVTCPPVP